MLWHSILGGILKAVERTCHPAFLADEDIELLPRGVNTQTAVAEFPVETAGPSCVLTSDAVVANRAVCVSFYGCGWNWEFVAEVVNGDVST